METEDLQRNMATTGLLDRLADWPAVCSALSGDTVVTTVHNLLYQHCCWLSVLQNNLKKTQIHEELKVLLCSIVLGTWKKTTNDWEKDSGTVF